MSISLSRIFRLASALLLALVAALTLPATQALATYGHMCTVIADEDDSTSTTQNTIESVYCSDFNVFYNSNGDLAVQAVGSALCQNKPLGTATRCAGIQVTVSIYVKGFDPSSTEQHEQCGRYNGIACPVGRFYAYSSGLYCHASLDYEMDIEAKVYMPKSGNFYVSSSTRLYSGSQMCS